MLTFFEPFCSPFYLTNTWLGQYGSLTKKQIVALLYHKSEPAAERIISNLLKARLIFRINGGVHLSNDPIGEIDQKIITAIWILTKFIQSIDPMAHYPAEYPSQLFFLKEGIGYEVIVLYEHEEYLLRQLCPRENMKYIIVLPDIAMAHTLVLPDVPCLFATVTPKQFHEVDIKFHSEEDLTHDRN